VPASGTPHLFDTKLEVHDRKQFELKLEYQPSGTDPESQYLVEVLFFVPKSLNITSDTWSRDSFYADLHNYVRLKTPVLSFTELLTGRHSPLVHLEERVPLGLHGEETELIYDAKMLACVLRATLRRFGVTIKESCQTHAHRPSPSAEDDQRLLASVKETVEATQSVLNRYRAAAKALGQKYPLDEKTRLSLSLVDEYLSLVVEQYMRRVVVQMDSLPRTGVFVDLRRHLMDLIVADESYRRKLALPSVLAPNTDNEEYIHRAGFLKKFCMNILFLKVQRSGQRKAWEEVLFAMAAGGSMAFALGVGFFAQSRYPQASFNFFLLAVVGYMLKDRIKEGLRRFVSAFIGKWLFERTTVIVDPVTRDDVGICSEKIDYGDAVQVPEEIVRVRSKDDLTAASQGELAETVIRYRKKIALDSAMLPRIGDGIVTGVTDIIRLNIDRLLHDMDDPEYAIDYVDLADYSIEKLKAVKSYRVDLAFRFSVDDGTTRETTYRCVRLILDRNGIKRMTELSGDAELPIPAPSPSAPEFVPARASGDAS
jgi:hypothetical protein